MNAASAQLKVLMSGGFTGAYGQLIANARQPLALTLPPK
jgi:hypothetical protein